jgi:cob(I)alamin adenosyltransferase
VVGLARLEATAFEIDALLEKIQNWLFDLGAELASSDEGSSVYQALSAEQTHVLEQSMDAMASELQPLKAFILPGGSRLAANLHIARSVCRRAERSVLELHQTVPVRTESRVFLNRLSDWFFVAARWANAQAGEPDVAWRKIDP